MSATTIRPLRTALLLLAAACTSPPPKAKPAASAEPRTLAPYVRTVYDRNSDADPGRWIGQTSVRTLRQPDRDVSVVLLSMVHIAKAEYYAGMTAHLRDADLVLAESSGGQSPGQRLPDDQLPEEGLWVRRELRLAARLLGLEQQGHWEARVMDRRWVVADMAMEQVLREVEEKEVAFLGPEDKARVERLEALVSGSPSPEALADARARYEDLLMGGTREYAGPDGPEREFQEQREKAMWRVIREQLATGKHTRVVLVFGAFHAPTLEAHLVNELGFRLEAACWHDAFLFEARPAPTGDTR